MKVLATFFAICLFFSLSSCAPRDMPACRDILEEIMQAEIGLPAGRVYSTTAEAGSAEYLSDHLVYSLYGNGERPVMADGWLDLALFLPSSLHPCEIAIFLCDSQGTATDTARMLCRRLDLLRVAKENDENSSYFEGATVTVMKNYVLLVISSDTENALKLAAKIID